MHLYKPYFKRCGAGCVALVALIWVATSCYAGDDTSNMSAAHHGEGKDSANVPSFESLDADSDQYITYPEVERFPGLEAVFGGLDADRDGKLSAREYDRFETLQVDKAPADASDLPKKEGP